jgi:hypothetical protein
MASSEVSLVDETGELYTVDPSEADKALAQGYRIASPEEIARDDVRLNTEESPFKAGLAGAARGATFGLSDQALTRAGLVDAQTLAGLEIENPGASLTGEIAGIGATSFLPWSPVARAAQLGKAVTGAVLPTASTAARFLANPATSPVVNKILTQAPSAALGLGTEGAFYGLGKSITEEALGDPTLTGEKILANIGHSALLGGGLGAGFKTAGIVVPPYLQAAKRSIKSLYEKGLSKLGEVSSFVSGKPNESIQNLLKKRAKLNISPEEQQKVVTDLADNFSNHMKTMERVEGEAFALNRPAETEKALKGISPAVAKTQYESTLERVEAAVSEMNSHSVLYPAGVPEQLTGFLGEFKKTVKNKFKPVKVFEAINDLKRNIDTEIKYGKAPTAQDQKAQQLIKGLRLDIKKNLENLSIWGEAGARQAAVNRAYNARKTNLKDLQKSFMQKRVDRSGNVYYKTDPGKFKKFVTQVGNERGILSEEVLLEDLELSAELISELEKTAEATTSQMSLGNATARQFIEKGEELTAEALERGQLNRDFNLLNAGAHNAPLFEAAAIPTFAANPALGLGVEAVTLAKTPGLAIRRLMQIEEMSNKVTKLVERGVKPLFSNEGRVAQTVIRQALTKDEQIEKDQKLFKELNDHIADPVSLIDQLQEQTQPLYDVAPQTAAALQMTTATATLFLQSKVPKEPDTKAMQTAFIPSQASLAKFNRYYSAVNNPLIAIDQIARGTLTPETIETLQVVYPSLYQSIQEEIMNQMIKNKGKPTIGHQKKMMLGMFMGTPLVNSMQQPNILANQASFLAEKHAQDEIEEDLNKKQTNPKAISKLGISERSKTPLQKSAQRDL